MASTPAGQTPPQRPDLGATGTHPREPAQYQCALLRAHGEALASECTGRFYAAWPELMARYGERGREHCYADQFWHLSTLDAALALGSPAIFIDYARWLRGFLAGRGMGDAYSRGNFSFLHDALERLELPPSQAEERSRVLAYVAHAIASFSTDAVRPAGPEA